MADMPSQLWGGWIAAVTIVSLIALAWLVVSVYFSGSDSHDIAEQTWDETLREGTHPAPLWWFWFILALMVVSVVYLILYPGLGTFRGALNWSQGGRIADSVALYEQRLGPVRARVAESSVADLQNDAAAMGSARRIFANHCAACHGPHGEGQADLFPGLMHGVWQWGGSPADIERTIRNGRQAVMPPWQAALGDERIGAVTDYVLALATGEANGAAGEELELGRNTYRSYCSACHGPTGAGMAPLGAPALDNDVWVYGGTRNAVEASIAEGRNGIMPAFGDRLDAAQIRLLVAWLTREAE
jgi:cytochrome c oxidase cbb3-type subunit III